MNRKLKAYKICLKTDSPVFVGSGREYTKKEYLFLSRKEVGILDTAKLYQFMKAHGIQSEFEDYVLNGGRTDLSMWLKQYRLDSTAIRPCVKYTLDSGDTVLLKGTKTTVVEHMKDPFGQPYIPGSTLKGMLRTVLLADTIMMQPDAYDGSKRMMEDGLNKSGKRNSYLKWEVSRVEQKTFNVLERDGTKPNDAVNDVLSGMIVSDSEPILTDHLVLCQKIDKRTDGLTRTLPLLRESIRPGTDIQFTLTLDESVCEFTVENILDAIDNFNECYNECFLSAFEDFDSLQSGQLILGGGTGFVNKTILYPMFGKKAGIKAAQKVFRNTGVPENHKHRLDGDFGASPHMLKCTKYQGQLVQMGLCEIAAVEEL